MPSDTQQIAAICSKVVPFRAVPDDADMVVVTAGAFGPPPTFQVMFGKYTPGVPEVPGKPEVPQQSGPGLANYVPFKPAVPPVPAVPPKFDCHCPPITMTLTQDEWDNWGNAVPDNEYILSLVAKRYGQTLVKS